MLHGAWGHSKIRSDQRTVKLTPLTALIFFMSATKLFHTLARPAQAVSKSRSLEEANDALHAIGIKTELDLERERYPRQKIRSNNHSCSKFATRCFGPNGLAGN